MKRQNTHERLLWTKSIGIVSYRMDAGTPVCLNCPVSEFHCSEATHGPANAQTRSTPPTCPLAYARYQGLDFVEAEAYAHHLDPDRPDSRFDYQAAVDRAAQVKKETHVNSNPQDQDLPLAVAGDESEPAIEEPAPQWPTRPEALLRLVAKICSRCDEELPIDKFSQRPGGTYYSMCDDCRTQAVAAGHIPAPGQRSERNAAGPVNEPVIEEQQVPAADEPPTEISYCTGCRQDLPLDRYSQKKNGDYYKMCDDCRQLYRQRSRKRKAQTESPQASGGSESAPEPEPAPTPPQAYTYQMAVDWAAPYDLYGLDISGDSDSDPFTTTIPCPHCAGDVRSQKVEAEYNLTACPHCEQVFVVKAAWRLILQPYIITPAVEVAR